MEEVLNELLPLDLYEGLPEPIKSCTDLFSEREKDVVLLSLIGTLSAALPNVYGYYGGNKVYPNLYLFIVAPPASGKGVMNFSKLLIKPIHEKIYNDSITAISDCLKQKKKDGVIECPPVRVKIIPGNISSAEIYSMINNSDFGGLIFESEADTLSTILQQDWSSFSDVLRKAFHHENISISRKTDRLYFDVERPRLSIVLSGTENQVMPLVDSKENGLYSRFIFYHFSDTDAWKDVFSMNRSIEKHFAEMSKSMFTIYAGLRERPQEVEISFQKHQIEKFNEEFENINSIVNNNHSLYFSSVVKRHGLIMFRIAMILTSLRVTNNIETNIEVNDVDFEIALKLVKRLLKHSLYIFNSIAVSGMSEADEKLLFNLPALFTRANAVDEGGKMNFTARTVDNKLKQWTKDKYIKKLSHGNYKRL